MQLEMERVNVQALLEEVLATASPLAEDHGSTLTLAGAGCASEIMTSPQRVRQVLTNLLSYAIERGAARPVEVRCAGEADGGVVIEIVSEARGLAPEAVPRMLDEFIELEDAFDCESDLEFCRRLGELLHGTVEVEVRPQGGSTFRLSLPKAPHGA